MICKRFKNKLCIFIIMEYNNKNDDDDDNNNDNNNNDDILKNNDLCVKFVKNQINSNVNKIINNNEIIIDDLNKIHEISDNYLISINNKTNNYNESKLIYNNNNNNKICKKNIKDNIKEDNIKEDNIKEDNIKEDNIKEDNINNEIVCMYKELVKDFDDFSDFVIKGILKFKLSIKKLEKTINKSKNCKKNSSKNIDWGFTEQRVIPKSIELFFNIEANSKLPRAKIGGFFQKYIEKNNLKGNINSKNKLDKRIYKLDDELTKLFGLSIDEKNKINSCTSSKIKYPNGFNFYNYQQWIKKLYIDEFGDDTNKIKNI